jgi:hypothetical protein
LIVLYSKVDRAKCLNPCWFSFKANEGFKFIISATNRRCPLDTAICNGVSTNCFESILSKTDGSSWIYCIKEVYLPALAVTFSWSILFGFMLSCNFSVMCAR